MSVFPGCRLQPCSVPAQDGGLGAFLCAPGWFGDRAVCWGGHTGSSWPELFLMLLSPQSISAALQSEAMVLAGCGTAPEPCAGESALSPRAGRGFCVPSGEAEEGVFCASMFCASIPAWLVLGLSPHLKGLLSTTAVPCYPQPIPARCEAKLQPGGTHVGPGAPQPDPHLQEPLGPPLSMAKGIEGRGGLRGPCHPQRLEA